jgi:hypothetical protein
MDRFSQFLIRRASHNIPMTFSIQVAALRCIHIVHQTISSISSDKWLAKMRDYTISRGAVSAAVDMQDFSPFAG